MREAGADALSFPIIAAAGPNSALPHAIAGNRPIEAGEPILLDWGARIDAYCSDISRTLVWGTPDKRFETLYAIVQEAQQKAVEAIRPGIGAREVDQIARNHIARMGYGEYFSHSLGHGVGLRVHEHPRLGPSSDQTLVPGMVVTVEPGIYLPHWGGIRIENMVWIREDGPEVLNGLDTAMTCLE
jgi:Xaa-Pro aminopeptidase